MPRAIIPRGNLTVTAALGMLMAGLLSACGLFGTTGEGPLTSETRPVTGFRRIDASNGIGVTVRFGATTSVEVSAQSNILPIIASTVEGDTLKLRSTSGFTTSAGVGVTVVVPALSAVTLSGGSQGVIEGFAADSLTIALDGGASLTASGTASTITLTASGGAVARLDALTAETVNIQASGGANATVRASREVVGSASGGAHVTVLGDAILNVEASGGASVSRD